MGKSSRNTPKKFRAVSLFSNCGAGDIGYAQAGFCFDVMAELDPRRLKVALLNHSGATGVPGDLRRTWRTVVREYKKRAGKARPALLAACPPCQGLSTARSGRGAEEDADAGSKDSRNLLVSVIARVAKALEPSIVVVENVPAFLTRKVRHPITKQPVSAAKILIDQLRKKYEAFPLLVDLCDYGVPQSRKRTFLTFIRRDTRILKSLLKHAVVPYPKPRWSSDFGGSPISIRDALLQFGLPSLDAGSPLLATSDVGKGLHSVPVWKDRRYQMVAAIPPNSGRSAWMNDVCSSCRKVEPSKLAAECSGCGKPLLRPVFRKRSGDYRLIHGFQSSTYARMEPNEPAATITTASGHIGSNHTIHPYENRVLSPLECAYLQTFPKTFRWGAALEEWGHTNVRQMIGEAVPPLFTRQHGRVLVSLLEKRLSKLLLPANDRRGRKARKKLGTKTKENVVAT